MIQYFVLCIFTMLAGVGLIRVVRIPLSFLCSILLGPTLTMSIWVIFCGWCILFEYPVKDFCLVGWLITFALSMIGLISVIRHIKYIKISFQNILLITTIFLLPIVVMAPYFWHGLFNYGGANAADGWSYIAFGQYLWENVRGAEEHLIPLYQYAAHLSHNRFIASALLAFLTPFVGYPGDTQATANLFSAWCIFNITTACAFFGVVRKLGKLIPIYLFLIIFSGWMLGLLATNNFDNALIIPLLPIFAGIGAIQKSTEKKWALVLALLFASTMFCYIEFCPFIFILAFILIIMQESRAQTDYLKIIVVAMLLTLILVLPYLDNAIHFFQQQYGAYATHGVMARPGEFYFGSLTKTNRFFVAYWGFNANKWYGLFCSLFFIVVIPYGLILLWRGRQRELVCVCLILLSCSFYMIIVQHYSYGAYKFILLNWWLLMYCVIKAVQEMTMNMQKRQAPIVVSLLVLFGVFYLDANLTTMRRYASTVVVKNIDHYRNLTHLRSIVHDKAILVTVTEDFANVWAVYFLRDFPIKLTTYRLYMAQSHVLPFMYRAKAIQDQDIQFLLTDNANTLPRKNLVWSSQPYYLWKLTKQ